MHQEAIEIFLEIVKSGRLPPSTPDRGHRIVAFGVRGDRYHHHQRRLRAALCQHYRY
jgi:hypothetical protein